MIIKSLKLDPFAGISDKKVTFKKGLNVILGPNEAGKSTLLNALQLILFVPTDCGKRMFDQEISHFMPLTGGNTIRIGLDFKVGKRAYSVTKSWGYSQQVSELRLPGGGLITNAEDVQEELGDLLVVGRGTFDSVLFGSQSRLGYTYTAIRGESPTMQDLASILRQAVFETEGMSIEQLGYAINRRFDRCFKRWDRDLRRPEKNRQIDHPWKNEVGKILETYYRCEKLRQQARNVEQHEAGVLDLDKAAQEHLSELGKLHAYLKKHERTAADLRQRQVLIAQRDVSQTRQKTLHEASKLWAKTLAEITSMQTELKSLEKNRKSLQIQMDRAVAYESHKTRLGKHKLASKTRVDLEREQIVLSKMKVIEERDYRELQRASSRLLQLQTSLRAGTLALTMTAKRAISFGVSKDFEKETQHRLAARKSIALSAGGQFQIDHEDWTLNVRSGDANLDELKRSLDSVSKKQIALLKRLRVSDLDGAGKAYDSYQKQRTLVASLQKQLEGILDGDTYEDLDKLAKTVSRAKAPSRTSGSIGQELGTAMAEISSREKTMRSLRQTLSGLEKNYDSQNGLLELLVNENAELKRIQIELKKLKPVPKSVEEPERFIMEYDTKQSGAREKERELNELRVKRAQVEAQAPAETREEIQSELSQAELDLTKAETEGAAISEILDTFRTIEEEMDSRTLDPWLKELGTILEPLTADRYKQIHLSGADSGDALREDGLAIPFALLSVGTKVGLGLALRLSMARYFLRDSEGFLVLDDPLVDMDPDRQCAAAKIVQGFAQEKQVIVTTCQPDHADFLGGHTIAL